VNTDQRILSPNFTHGRLHPIDLIVIHYTGSLSYEGALEWFRNPQSQVSAHYVIGRDGGDAGPVAEGNTAWHAGRDARWGGEGFVNSRSIGIELVGTQDSGFESAQLATLWGLLAYLVRKYQIVAANVVGHKDVLPGVKIDPDGLNHQFPWEKAFAVATEALGLVPGETSVPAPL
jgi:N-acetylmuramoyl-L-alanine amidase